MCVTRIQPDDRNDRAKEVIIHYKSNRCVSLCLISASYAELIGSLLSRVRAYMHRVTFVRSLDRRILAASYRRVARLSASGFAHNNWACSSLCRIKTIEFNPAMVLLVFCRQYSHNVVMQLRRAAIYVRRPMTSVGDELLHRTHGIILSWHRYIPVNSARFNARCVFPVNRFWYFRSCLYLTIKHFFFILSMFILCSRMYALDMHIWECIMFV